MTVSTEVDRPGGLSIVVQGALGPENSAEVARHLDAWRRLFPAAQLVCVVSTGEGDASGRVATACDVLVRAPEAAELPPMKTDSPGPNNVNRMIATARAGLASAQGRYVLRIRNDLLLRDRTFVALLEAGQAEPRGRWSFLAERVLIPEVFTLNPFTVWRMPFHFSDWFHFGLTQDVAAIWDAARPLTLAEATYYDAHRHRWGSNRSERRFRTRWAPEQTVHFPAIARAFPHLRLARHNDVGSVEESLFVLADNFVLADLNACAARIAKYQPIVDAMSDYTRLECLSDAQVRARADRPDMPAAMVFADVISATRRFHALPGRLRRAVRSRAIRLVRKLRAIVR